MTNKIDQSLIGLQRREESFEIREVNEDKREIVGIAVPWNQRANIGGWFTEEFERGSVDDEGALYFYGHREPIGRITNQRDTDEGREITAVVSKTRSGDDALTLARDGVLTKHSVGFEFGERTIDETGDIPHIKHTAVKVREVSLVPFPAYEGAEVKSVRDAHHTERETPMVDGTDTLTIEELERRTEEAIQNMQRTLHVKMTDAFGRVKTPAADVDTRSVGEFLKALVRGGEGSEEAKSYNAYERAWEANRKARSEGLTEGLQERAMGAGGIVMADGIMHPQWIGDLTNIVEEAAPLRSIFGTGALPSNGMTLEWGQLKTNTVTVAEQVLEGDDLVKGKVSVETKADPIRTAGGWSELSIQAIERTETPILDLTFEAQAAAVGKYLNAAMRRVFKAVHTQRTAIAANAGVILLPAAPKAKDWLAALVDAVDYYTDLGFPMSGLLVNKVLFKEFAAMEDTTGRPLFLVDGSGNNNVGTLNPLALDGKLPGGLRVMCDPKLGETVRYGAFVNGRAIKQFDDGIHRLQDQNIVNLTKQFSVYTLEATVPQIPGAIVPVKFAP